MKSRISDVILEGARTRSTGRRGRATRQDAPTVERWLRANSGALTFAGLTLGVFVSRKFFILPLAAIAGLVAEGARDVVQRATGTTAS